MTGYDLSFTSPLSQYGRLCRVARADPLQPAHNSRLAVKGAKLFNLVPRRLRDLDGELDTFTQAAACLIITVSD